MRVYIDIKTNEVHSFKFFVQMNFKKLKNESCKVVKNVNVDATSKELYSKVTKVLTKLAVNNTIKSIKNYQLIEVC